MILISSTFQHQVDLEQLGFIKMTCRKPHVVMADHTKRMISRYPATVLHVGWASCLAGTLYTSDPITQNSELEYTMAYIKQAVAMLMDPPLNPNTLVTTIGAQYEISNEVTILGLFNNFGFTELDTLVVTASGSVSNDPTLVGFDGVQ